MIQPEFGFGLDRFRNDVVRVADSYADYEIHYGGTAYVTGSVPQLRDDVQLLIKAGLIIMLIVACKPQSLKAVIMVFIVIIPSLFAMMGFMGWAYKITGANCFICFVNHQCQSYY